MNPLRQHLTTPLRQWLADRRTVRRGRQDLRQWQQAYYGFWEPQTVTERWFYHFLQRPAFTELPSSVKINFFSVFCRRRLLGMTDDAVPRVFFTGENLANYPVWADHALGEVDLSLGFAQLQADNYLRFPLWLLDMFPAGATRSSIQLRLDEMNDAAADFGRRNKFAALVARHDNNGIRADLADLLAGYGRVDYPGAFRNNIPAGLAPGYDSKLGFLRQYRFNVCPENSDATGYVTEKLWHAIAAGCIPVYWGSDNRPEPGILNPEAYLVYAPDNPDALHREITALMNDQTALANYAQQARFLPGAAAEIHGYFMALEAALLKILRTYINAGKLR